MYTICYKEYVGTFNYIEEDDVLYGKIEGITDLITFEGNSVSEIKKAFQDAVEDYLELCKEAGK